MLKNSVIDLALFGLGFGGWELACFFQRLVIACSPVTFACIFVGFIYLKLYFFKYRK